jgi:hypothetical protein
VERLEAEALQVELARQIEEERLAEEARKAEEDRNAEEKRKADERAAESTRKAEQSRTSTMVVELPPRRPMRMMTVTKPREEAGSRTPKVRVDIAEDRKTAEVNGKTCELGPRRARAVCIRFMFVLTLLIAIPQCDFCARTGIPCFDRARVKRKSKNNACAVCHARQVKCLADDDDSDESLDPKVASTSTIPHRARSGQRKEVPKTASSRRNRGRKSLRSKITIVDSSEDEMARGEGATSSRANPDARHMTTADIRALCDEVAKTVLPVVIALSAPAGHYIKARAIGSLVERGFENLIGDGNDPESRRLEQVGRRAARANPLRWASAEGEWSDVEEGPEEEDATMDG